MDSHVVPDNPLFADITEHNELVVWLDSSGEGDPIIFYRKERCPDPRASCHLIQLSDREREVLKYYSEAWPYFQEHDIQQMTYETVEYHAAAVLSTASTLRQACESLERSIKDKHEGPDLELKLSVMRNAWSEVWKFLRLVFEEHIWKIEAKLAPRTGLHHWIRDKLTFSFPK